MVEGEVVANGERVSKGNMLVSKDQSCCNLQVQSGAHLLVFGGEPFETERNIHWNFVSSSKEKLEQAKQAWANKTFPMMENDDTYVPLPN